METETIEAPVDTEDATDAEIQAAADAGFEDDDPPEDTPLTDQASDPAKEDADESTDALVVEDPVIPVEPEYTQITKGQLAELEAGAKTARDLDALGIDQQLRKAFGKTGNLEEIIKGLQEATPAGQDVVVSEEDFEEVRTEHELPELASSIVKGLNRVFARAKLKGTAPAPTPEFDPSQFEAAVNERVEARLQKDRGQVKDEVMADVRKETTAQLVSSKHSDWEEYTPTGGPEGGEGAKFKPFREWVVSQGADYAQKLNDSWNSGEITEALTKFKEFSKKPPKSTSRTDQLRENLTPRGSGVQHTAQQTVEEAADEGFRDG